MAKEQVRLTLIDRPTLLIEIAGLRILTDPTFDEPREYSAGDITVWRVEKVAEAVQARI